MALCFQPLVRSFAALAMAVSCVPPLASRAQPRPDGPLDAVTVATPEVLARESPGKQLAIKRALAEGNHVIVHRWSKLPAMLGATEHMAIHIFRLGDCGKIVKPWGVQQRIPRSSTNRNSIF